MQTVIFPDVANLWLFLAKDCWRGVMESFLEETSNIATIVLATIPQRMAHITNLLATEFPPRSPSQMAAALTQGVSVHAESNTHLTRLVTLVLDEIHIAIQELQRLERWIQLLVPPVADGNNFGVEVQKSVQLQISASRTALQKSWDSMTDYFWQRATAFEKFSAKESTNTKLTASTTKDNDERTDELTHKTSHVKSVEETKSESSVIPDFLAYIVAIDVKWYFNLQRTLESVGDHYAFTLDAVQKNSSKVRLPRGHGERNMTMF